MANRDINNKMVYWYEGSSASSIKTKLNAPVGWQNYWYNGSVVGFVAGFSRPPVPRTFSVLIGF
jgi:hypothetical protein